MDQSLSVSSATTPEAEQAVADQYNRTVEAPTSTIELNESGVDRITVRSEPVTADTQSLAPQEYKMPEKFANAADPNAELLKAYLNLEQSKGQPQAQPEAAPAEPREAAQESPAFDITKYHTAWDQQGGELNEDQWSQIQKDTNLPMDVLKQYESMYKAKAKDTLMGNDDKIYNLSGGKEKYDTMIEWANTNMNTEQIQALNMQLDNPAFSEMGVKMLSSMYNSNVGFEATKSTLDKATHASNAAEADDFKNDADFQRAMNDKRYGEDGAYDEWVDKKLIKMMKMQGQIK